MEKVKVGIIGTGTISGIYLESPQKFPILDIVAVADIDLEKAREKAKQYNIQRVLSVQEMLDDPEIKIIINLTIPKVHAEINLLALEAGKHVFVEKPLATQVEDGMKIIAKANEKGLRVGSAPDTFLGGGIQTCRKLIDDGWIGKPIAASAFVMEGGPEGWHPNPDFYYQKGGGPMFDMGPYYLTALINLIGPIKKVTGSAQMLFSERIVTRREDFGRKIPVETPTHVTGILEFDSGAVGTVITSFDIKGGSNLPRIEIYGTMGTLSVPDPNYFGGSVYIHRVGEDKFTSVPLSFGFTENSRGIGVADMAYAISNKRPHRANGELALHVLEIMHAIHEASKEEKHVYIENKCERPAALPVGFSADRLDLF